jgi:hypothetical protein
MKTLVMPVTALVPARALRQLTDIQFCVWVGEASPGDQLEYHIGFLAIDATTVISRLPEPDRRLLAALAAAARRASDAGLVRLVQKRLGPNRFAYLAVTQPKPRSNPVPLSSLLPQPETA